jgi:hypothetical protein
MCTQDSAAKTPKVTTEDHASRKRKELEERGVEVSAYLESKVESVSHRYLQELDVVG